MISWLVDPFQPSNSFKIIILDSSSFSVLHLRRSSSLAAILAFRNMIENSHEKKHIYLSPSPWWELEEILTMNLDLWLQSVYEACLKGVVMAGHNRELRVRNPLAFYTKLNAKKDIVIHQICSSRMELNAGKVKLLPLIPLSFKDPTKM